MVGAPAEIHHFLLHQCPSVVKRGNHPWPPDPQDGNLVGHQDRRNVRSADAANVADGDGAAVHVGYAEFSGCAKLLQAHKLSRNGIDVKGGNVFDIGNE